MATIHSINKYFEDLDVGDVFTTPRRTVTETDLVFYSGLSGDYSPHHTDELFAAAGPFKARIAHGLLTMSIATGLEFSVVSPGDKIVAFYGMDRVRFVKPVFCGDTIHVRGEVMGLEEKDDTRGVVTIRQEIRNQHDATCVAFEKRLLVSKKPA